MLSICDTQLIIRFFSTYEMFKCGGKEMYVLESLSSTTVSKQTEKYV